MRWELPAGVAAVLLLLLSFVPLWSSVATDLGDPPPGPPTPPPPPSPLVPIPTETTVTSQPDSVRKGEPFEVVGRVVVQATGEPAAGVTVKLWFNETKEQPGVQVGEGKTDEQGVYRITPDLRGIEPRDYQVVAQAWPLMVGDAHMYAMSWTDPPLRVLSASKLTLRAPEREGFGVPVNLTGRLEDETGEGVPQAPITLTIGTQTLDLATDGTGDFHHSVVFDAPGTYELRAAFAGSPNMDPAEVRATLEVVEVALLLPERLDAVRGEPFVVLGEVRFGGQPQAGVPVRLRWNVPTAVPEEGPEAFVAQRVSELVTGADGRFRDEQVIAATSPLGEQGVLATVEERGLVRGTVVAVRARATLTLDHPPAVDTGVAVTARLVDNLGLPVVGAAVRLEARGESGTPRTLDLTTGPQGEAKADLDLGPWPDQVALHAAYAGDANYLAAERASEVRARGWLPLALLFPALVGAPLLGAAWAWANHRRFRDPPPAELSLEFPRLDPGLPAVWATAEPVEIAVRLQDAQGKPRPNTHVLLHVGSEAVRLRTGPDGRASVLRRFDQEGEVPLVAVAEALPGTPSDWAVGHVRIADYRKEVGREYEDLLAAAQARGLAVGADTTARELERRLAETAPTPEELAAMLRAFEHASYSTRPFGRDAFIAFMRRRRRVGRAVERPPDEEGGEAHGRP